MNHPNESREQIADRISAYVYGNIMVMASLVVLHQGEVERGVGVALVVGAAASTFIAHAFAERLGAEVRQNKEASLRHVMHGSLPILSAASVPAMLMIVGAFGWLPPSTGLRLAEVWVIVRLGMTAFVVSRLQGYPVTQRTWFASFGLASGALLIVALKLIVTH